MEILHPINDPQLVSYHRKELVANLPNLELALDCWSLMNTETKGSSKKKYITKERAEPNEAYLERVKRSAYTPIYRDSIKAYAGLLSRFTISNPPQSIEEWKDNVDLQGSSFQNFFTRADELTIRDGGCFIYVEMMRKLDDSESNAIDERSDGRHPYLVLIERKDVINWSVDYIDGRERIKHATFRQIQQFEEGAYGVTLEPIYRCIKPYEVRSYRLERSSTDGTWRQSEIGAPVRTSMPFVPLVWYGASSSRFAQSDIPLSGLAELSIHHFQSRSDLTELFRKCAMPVPVRKGVWSEGSSAKPLVIGPNSCQDLPGEGSDFFFSEPRGSSLQRHQDEIRHIEMLMDRSGLNFLYGANIKTATEASLRASQVASQISALIRNKISAFNMMMRYWALYAGEQAQITKESGIIVNDSLINRPIDPSGIAQLINLRDAQIISTETALNELKRGGVLDPDMDLLEELSRVNEEYPKPPPTDNETKTR